jgi:DNA-binding transcriptional LysR family regulator
MRRDELPGLSAFLVVAEERSFTRAAARLGTSQSSLSQTVRRLEARLGLRLLTRTTRSVSPTDAGLRLLERLRPAFDQIDAELDALGEFRGAPSGSVRITTSQHAAETLLWPALRRVLADYPDIALELSIDSGFRDIVADRFDAGVRLGEEVAQDMIAVRIGPDLRMAAVASPDYLARHPAPLTPHDLTRHRCINLRFPTLGGLYVWEFEKDGRELNVRVGGQLTFNDRSRIIEAALDGFGIGFLAEDSVLGLVAEGRLVRTLEDWCAPFAGYHLYYPSRRQLSPAFGVLVEALRYKQRPQQRADPANAR